MPHCISFACLSRFISAYTQTYLMKDRYNFDVIIIGGSYSGLSAAMALGRSLKKVLIIDSGAPCNITTPHSHNFITQDGKSPGEISSEARLQVLRYETVTFHEGLAVQGKRNEDSYTVITQKGEAFTAKKLIFATGIKDLLPGIKGLSDCWGVSVIHCPYCHGYEFRNRTTGILANGEKAFHIASLVNNLTDNISILTSGKADFTVDQLERLRKHRIRIIETEVCEIVHEKSYLRQVVFKDGSIDTFEAVYAAVPFRQHSDIPAALGCELTEAGYIKVDAFQRTTVDGVYACGDNAAMMRTVASAVYTGNLAGAMVNKELTEERF